MTGTQNFACLCGARAAVDYIANIGHSVADDGALSRRSALQIAYNAIEDYENTLCQQLLAGLETIAASSGITIHGISVNGDLENRVPTVSISHPTWTSAQLAQALGDYEIYAWHGNYYALQLTRALQLEPEGMLRLGLVHYNTVQEIDRLLLTLSTILKDEPPA
jgi:selenocysteine lyase/cysteine desulfurase